MNRPISKLLYRIRLAAVRARQPQLRTRDEHGRILSKKSERLRIMRGGG